MARKYSFHDIKVNKKPAPKKQVASVRKKSISGISAKPTASPRKALASARINREPERPVRASGQGVPPTRGGGTVKTHKSYAKPVMWSVAILLLGVSVFLFSGIFTKATIAVTPKQEKISIDGQFKAEKAGVGLEELSFDVMSIEKEVSKTIAAETEEMVETQASGRIVVYNAHDENDQRLIKNTRFETPDGKIYRIKESIVVPGTSVVNGEIIPGSIEVTVYADQPGEEYNIDRTDFTIPGFKGGPRYDNFYARSKTPMTGGFSGIVFMPAEEDLERVRDELKAELATQLKEEAPASVPENFVLFDGATLISYEDDNPAQINPVSDTQVEITQKGKLEGFIFNRQALMKFIGSHATASYESGSVRMPTLTEDIKFAFANKDIVTPEDQVISFTLSGSTQMIWDVDDDNLKTTLAGASRKNFEQILADFPNVAKANASIRPFWMRSFPEDPEEIELKEILE